MNINLYLNWLPPFPPYIACHKAEGENSAAEEEMGLCFYNRPVLGSLIRSEALHTFLRHERSGRRLVTAASSPQITAVLY